MSEKPLDIAMSEYSKAVEALAELQWEISARRGEGLIGQRFGRLIVKAGRSGGSGKGALYRCECDCGGVKVVRSNHLKSGFVGSCGCAKLEHLERIRKLSLATFESRREKARGGK